MTSDAQILARPVAMGDAADPRRWLTLIILLLAAFMNLLDVSIVNVALPSIRGDLGFSATGLQWVVNAYTLAFAGFLMLGQDTPIWVLEVLFFLMGTGMAHVMPPATVGILSVKNSA